MSDKKNRLKQISIVFPLVMDISKEQRVLEQHVKKHLHTMKLDDVILFKKKIDNLGAKIKGYVTKLNKLGLEFQIEDLRR